MYYTCIPAHVNDLSCMVSIEWLWYDVSKICILNTQRLIVIIVYKHIAMYINIYIYNACVEYTHVSHK